MPRTTLRRVKQGVYGVEPALYYVLLRKFSGGLEARTYTAGGVLVETRATLADQAVFGIAQSPIAIPLDSGGNVGPGAFAWRNGATLWSWDVDGNSTATYSPSAGLFASDPIYYNGKLWWWELGAGNTADNLKLRRANCDFSSPETLNQLTVNPASWSLWNQDRQLVALNASAMLVCDRYFAGSTKRFTARLPINGSPGTFDPNHDAGIGRLAPDGAVGSVGFGLPVSAYGTYGSGICSMADSIAASVAFRWPTTGTWEIDSETGGAPKGWHVSADGSKALLCGPSGYPYEPVLIAAPSSATAGTPTSRVDPFGEAASETPDLFGFVAAPRG